jgi:hypothetical protein
MKINLRKAHAIQQQIREELNRLDFSTEVQLNEYEWAEDQVKAAKSNLENHLVTWDKLLGIMLDIRKKVAQANADEGISDLLADAASIDKQIQLYTQLANAQPQEKVTVLNGRLKKRADSAEESVYSGFGSNGIRTGILTEKDINEYRVELANLKRTKQGVQEMILAANIETEIDLDEHEEKLLARLGIISDFDG